MYRKCVLVGAAILTFAGVEVVGNMLWPTQCSRCAPLRVSSRQVMARQAQMPTIGGCTDAEERVTCPMPEARITADC
jgi:hypothetical protein